MLSLRAPARRPVPRLCARVLVFALLAGLLPVDAYASVPTPRFLSDPQTLPEPDFAAPPPPTETVVCIVVVAANPLWLTKSAFGERLEHTGTDPQPYAFTGEPLDLNVGWQHHRARWMDPAVGRFVRMDPWEGSRFEPATLHRYLYVAGDPVGKVDPSGLEFNLPTVTAMIGTIGTLATRSFGAIMRGLQTVRAFSWNNRVFARISRAYWRKHGPAAGRSLHHWLFPRRWTWIPQGIRNAGFNLIELPHLLPGRLSLNTWMGFAVRWGGYRAVLAGFVENGIRVAIPVALYLAAEAGAAIGDAIVRTFFLEDIEHELRDQPDLLEQAVN